jgi:hypothetical protein
MNELIFQYLKDYTENPDPQYAVMLKGKWGCGKTFFIKNWLENNTGGNSDEDENLISIKPIYISLYGMNSIMDIRSALDREINPFFYSKSGKVITSLAKIAGKVILKTNFNITGDGKDDTSFSGSLDSLALFNSKDDVIKGVKFIIFDDIERCQIEMKQLLGFINYFVEHCSCHVIIIGDDTHLENEDGNQLNEFKEKTVGREFEIKPDTEAAIDYFLSEVPDSSILNFERDFIIKCFHATGNENLRILRQCLCDFKAQLALVDSEPIEDGNAFLHNLLCSFIAVYAEYNNKDNHSDILKLATSYQIDFVGGNKELINKIQTLNQKYSIVSEGCKYHALSPEYVNAIIQHITTGVSLKNFIKERLTDCHKELTAWEKLSSFWEMSNDEFTSSYDEAMKALLEKRIEPPYQIGTTISWFCYIETRQVRYFIEGHIALIKRNLRELIQSANEIDNLYQIKISLIQGCNHLQDVQINNSIKLADILHFIDSEVKKKKEEFPDLMQQALRELSDNNVGRLMVIDDYSYPDHSSTYKLRAIFAKEDPKNLFISLKGLSNRGRYLFKTFLSIHYSLNVIWTDPHDLYKADIEVLKDLKTMIDTEITKTVEIEKLTFKNLSKALQRSILRCEGQKQV